jgi:hypothetical protein
LQFVEGWFDGCKIKCSRHSDCPFAVCLQLRFFDLI